MTAQPDLIGLLVKILADTPPMADAECIGHTDLFDPQSEHEAAEDVTYRHMQAATICASCPVLSECDRWAQTERPSDGVLAGRIPPPKQRRGRPARSTA